MADPSNEVVEVLIQCMDWNISTRQSRIPLSELPELQQKAVDLLDLLQRNLPDKTGEKSNWNLLTEIAGSNRDASIIFATPRGTQSACIIQDPRTSFSGIVIFTR